MTCIVAIKDHKNSSVILGADSASVGDYGTKVSTIRKLALLRTDDVQPIKLGIGYTSSFRMGQILTHDFVPPRIDSLTPLVYMVTKFVPEIRRLFKDGGFAKIHDNEESGGTFIVTLCGEIFEIQDDFQVAQFEYDYLSIGCGDDFAMGSFATSGKLNMEPKKRALLALQAAAKFSGWVCAPFRFLTIGA